MRMFSRILFVALAVAVVLARGWVSPPIALLLGVAFGLVFAHPYAAQSRTASKWLLQASVVALGFAMDLHQVLRAGASGFLYTFVGIVFVLGAGWLLARMLHVPERSGYLISVGTAICGGSAIAAVAPVVKASDEEISVSIGTVFLLNAVGLLVFPPLGHYLQLSEAQFGLWAALAIHDTSSVVGAGAKYGAAALAIATTVKLARALWIVPLTLGTAAIHRRSKVAEEGDPEAGILWPWFILLFLLAAIMNSYLPQGRTIYAGLASAGKIGLTLTLFLIGSGMSRESLRRVGVRPLLMGVVLWVLVAGVSLWAIRAGWIAL